MTTIPSWLPATAQDLFNYIAKDTASDVQIQAVLRMAGHLDADRLACAVRLSLDAEPVLGCAFVEDPHHPHWQRRSDLDQRSWCPVTVVGDEAAEASVEAFLNAPLDPVADPLVLCRLLRTESADLLCIKVNHACSDGAGVKDYLRLLAEIYSALERDPGFVPVPNVRGRRGQDMMFLEAGIPDARMAWDPALAALQPTWAFPNRACEPAEPATAMLRFDTEVTTRLAAVARERGCTVNDLVLTAYYRALHSIIQPIAGPMEISVTADLRRYLPTRRAEAICNLSGSVPARVAIDPAEFFAETLTHVSAEMNRLKANRPGLHTAAAFELIAGQGYAQAHQILIGMRQAAVAAGVASPMLSNFGRLSDLAFGTVTVVQAFLVSPALFAPALMLGVSSYADRMTLTVRYHRSTTDPADVEQLLSRMRRELSV